MSVLDCCHPSDEAQDFACALGLLRRAGFGLSFGCTLTHAVEQALEELERLKLANRSDETECQ